MLRFPISSLTLVTLLAAAGAARAQEYPAPESSAQQDPARHYYVENVRFQFDQQTLQKTGRVVVEDTAGGLLLETPDGRRWVIEAADVIDREALESAFTPLTQQQLADQMLANLPDGFKVHTTPHYVVCYNTSRAYAQWTSSLLERLHRAFTNYWSTKGFELHEPEFPLPVTIYATAHQYRQASAPELGPAAGSVIGYYSLATNRVSMYDLTGHQAGRGGERGSLREVNQMLTQPAALPLVATVVHEATHQIAFNCGLQQRLAELPLWLVEGMAVYFEAPDLSSSRGWRGIGKVNYPRLNTFKANLRTPRRLSLLAMVADDKRFRNSRTAVDAYADAWALNYFLIRYHPDQYVAYVEQLSQQRPLVPHTAEERIEQFRKHFGDPTKLDEEFAERMSRLD